MNSNAKITRDLPLECFKMGPISTTYLPSMMAYDGNQVESFPYIGTVEPLIFGLGHNMYKVIALP